MGLERIRHKSGIAGISGGAQTVLGGFAALLGIALVVVYHAQRDNSVAYYIVYCLVMLLTLWGVRLFWRGCKTRRLVKQLGAMEKMFQNGNRVPLETAASYLRCSISTLVGDVREIQKRGFVSGLYADLLRRDLVSSPDGADTAVRGAAVDDGLELTEEDRMPVSPIYALGLTWVIWAIGLPMYRIGHFVACALLSAAVFVVVGGRASRQVVIVERRKAPPPPINTGNEALDGMLESARPNLEALRRIDREMTEGKVADVVGEILRTTEQIIDHVKEHPDSAGQIRQFLNYTLPTTISLLQNYQELSRQRVPGENIIQSLNKIEENIGTLLAAFHRQMDALFRDKALNIEVELDVMKGLLGQQNAGSNDFGANDFGAGGKE